MTRADAGAVGVVSEHTEYLQRCSAVSSVVVLAAGGFVAAASDSAHLELTADGARVGQARKLWAADDVVVGIAGAVSGPTVDLLESCRAALADARGDQMTVCRHIEQAFLLAAPILSLLAESHAEFISTISNDIVTAATVASADRVTVLCVLRTGVVSIVHHPTDRQMVVLALGAQPSAADMGVVMKDVGLALRTGRGQAATARVLAMIAADRVQALTLSPPRMYGFPTVAGPIVWAGVGGATEYAGQNAPDGTFDPAP